MTDVPPGPEQPPPGWQPQPEGQPPPYGSQPPGAPPPPGYGYQQYGYGYGYGTGFQYAGFWARFAAWLLDAIIIGIPINVISASSGAAFGFVLQIAVSAAY